MNDGSVVDAVTAFVLGFLFFAFRGQTLKWINEN